MALDNPSYFTVSGGGTIPTAGSSVESDDLFSHHTGSRGFTAFFRKKSIKMANSNTSTSVIKNGNFVDDKLTKEKLENEPRRSFRSLFRSTSVNADNETLQILKGEPRPADVAPPSPHLPHRSHSHSDHDRRRPNRRKILKSASELLSNDMVFCGDDVMSGNSSKPRHVDHDFPYVEQGDQEEDTGEIMLGIDDARYYNLSATLPAPGPSGSRRHSIGNFIEKENNLPRLTRLQRRRIIQTEGFIKEPDDFAPPIPTDQPDCSDGLDEFVNNIDLGSSRKHKSFSRKGSRVRAGGISSTKPDSTNASLMEDRDDVVFISSKDSEASTLWVNYLSACFEQISRQQGRPPFKVRHVTVEDAASMSPSIQERISKSRLQIIVVCPVLLERAATRPEQASTLARQLSPDRVLAMMLGVHDGHLSENQKTALITYGKWQKFFVKDQDETFVGEFLGAAVGILAATTLPSSSTLKNDKTTFTVHPKKVKIGQNRIIVILNDPLRPEDMISVIVDRCGEAIDISQVKKRNPYTLQFSIPERCLEVSMLVGVRIVINGIAQGVRQVKCESRLRELDQILRAHDNPLEFMCQTFGFNSGDREQLDNWMVHAFQKNLPPRFDLLSTPSGTLPNTLQKNTISTEEYPTLLHFAAKFGLEKLAWQLLECPGGEIACELKNISEMTPADIAEHSGHAKLAHQLRGYMQINEFTNMYSYLKVISENTNVNNDSNNNKSVESSSENNTEVFVDNDKEDYCRPRPLSDAYLIPPAARPVISPSQASNIQNFNDETNYSIVPPPTPVIGHLQSTNLDVNCLNLPIQGYMKMQPAGPKPVTAPLMALKQSTGSLTRSSSSHQDKKAMELNKYLSAPEDELLEIINDFKNNVFTISEVERLVETWKNRNDVQQNFKDKQRQLTAMRNEYERIQKQMKDEMKTPTPFDRIKKFFSKGKKDCQKKERDSSNDDNDGASTASETDNNNKKSIVSIVGSSAGSAGALSTSAANFITDKRPMSSLSLNSVSSSSSSSGRMSIISGCSGTSLGDSGTHSDTEDRLKLNHRTLSKEREDKAGMMNYEIPPVPKPFTGKYNSPPMRYTPSPRSSRFDNDYRRPSQGSSDDFYIAFPVSGLPIHSFNPDGSAIDPKTPSSPSDSTSQLLFSMSLNNNNNNNKILEEESSSEVLSLKDDNNKIPLDYINIGQQSNSENTVEMMKGEEKEKEEETVKVANDNQELKIIEDKSLSENLHENSNHVQEGSAVSSSFDVVDAARLPDYMNIQAAVDQEPKIVGLIPKKTAPPVPPRAPTKK